MKDCIDPNEYHALKRIVSELVYLARCQGWQFEHIEHANPIKNLVYQTLRKSPYEVLETKIDESNE